VFAAQPDQSEQGLEARFAANLLDTWKDYSAEIAKEVNKAQEEGLARILASVISGAESRSESGPTDPNSAYAAVSNFLLRRHMENVSLSSKEFLRRYKKEGQLRSVASDIEAVERKISQVTAPRDALRSLISEMFIGDKKLSLSDNSIEIELAGNKISLSTLSSGEKQLLRILIDTVIAGPSIVLIDEPELSMHIDWQRRLLSSMRVLNPLAQLIVATHSPEIMADSPDNQIFKL
jgi:predicted ATP-dependent endonuclease of OLD family